MGLKAPVVLAALLAALAPATPGAEREERVLRSRADALETVTGEIEYRRQYTTELALPDPACEGGPFTCLVHRTYGQVYALDFTEETRSRPASGEATSRRRSRGRLLVAVDLPPKAEDDFERALASYLNALSVGAFSLPQTGMEHGSEPLDQDILLSSAVPAWVCKVLEGTYISSVLFSGGVDGRTGIEAERACRPLEDAVASIPAEIVRTMPDVRAELRRTVTVESVSTMGGLSWADDLAPIPQGGTFAKRPLDGKKTGWSFDIPRGIFRGHSGRTHDIERDMRLPPAALRLVEAPMWVARFRFETVRETFGTESEVVRETPVSVVVAVVPVVDPLLDELTATRTALAVPEKQLMEELAERLGSKELWAPSLVEDAFCDEEVWPAQGDWLIVACRDDGSARYGIAPFAGAADVTNAEEACAAITRELGD